MTAIDGDEMNGRVQVRKGILHVDGKPQMYLCTDYPYFRDDPENWADRLRKQREAGVRITKVYVPWRHHAPQDPVYGDGEYDFTGRTQPNRNLKGLLDIAHEEGLLVILKPGPFVHAELPYGGLPDYVNPDRNPPIEPELNGKGERTMWSLERMRPASVHPVPAPFGYMYNAYVRDWFKTLAEEVAVPHFTPRGPVFAFQLLNEGIYSESSKAEPMQLGYSPSSLAMYHDFLKNHYGSLDHYNALHPRKVSDWREIDPPREVHPLGALDDLLAYLDWSRFQSDLYVMVARQYKSYLVEGGVPENVPVFFNFNPNGDTYRTRPASNDGWYTRVNVVHQQEFLFGSTNWIGVVSNDPSAYRQYVMATTAFWGPSMEQNWGFVTLYDPPYGFVTPSVFETMLSVACGATGITAYTLAGTRAWRNDPNMRGEWVPERTNDNLDDTEGDYPGAAPIQSDGRLTPKYWSLKQITQYFSAEGPRSVATGPVASIAWGIYPPYAWVGQWLSRGDPDDLLWRPPLRAIPRGAFHGLDAFVEMMTTVGVGFHQVDLARPDVDLTPYRVICLSAFEYMDQALQERLVTYVENGGTLLLTNEVPDKDVHLQPQQGALMERVFPHRVDGRERIIGTAAITREGETVGYAREFVFPIRPPADASDFVYLGERVVGYERKVGRGRAYYLGFGPWRARYSGDDRRVAATNQRLTWTIIQKLVGDSPALARPLSHEGEVVVWQHEGTGGDDQQVFVVVRDTDGMVRVAYTRTGNEEDELTVDSPSQAVHVVSLTGGRLRACYLKGTNDIRAEGVAPRVRVGDETWGAEDPCDVCITPTGDGSRLVVTVAHTVDGHARVRLAVPREDVERVTTEAGEPAEVDVEAVDDGVLVRLRDVRDAGAYHVHLTSGPRARISTPA